MAPDLSPGRGEAYVLKGKGEGRRILGQVIVPNTSSESWEGGGPGDYLPGWVKARFSPGEEEGCQERTGVFSVGAQGRGQRTLLARMCWQIRVGQGGKGGRRDGREKGAWGFFFRRRPIEQLTGGNERVWVLTRRLPGFRAGAVG